MPPRFIFPAFLILASPSPAFAESFDPNDSSAFHRKCSPAGLQSASGEVFGICVGFVDGLIARERVALNEKAFCIDEKIRRVDAYSTLWNYIETHPSERKFSTAMNALKALGKAYPCKKSGKAK